MLTIKNKPKRVLNDYWIIAIFAAISTIIFIGIGYLSVKPGFPLDDSWIHQTYARNLALTGRWEYVRGEISAGSTSPLWTILLSLGYLIRLKSPFLWTTLLSTLLCTGLAVTSYAILKQWTGGQRYFLITGSLLVVFDWHILWSAGSGMETLLYCFFCLLIFYLIFKGDHWLWIGIFSGLIIWVRPDGITVLGPVLLIFCWNLMKKQVKSVNIILLFLPLLAIIFFYGWFNYSLSGKIFPNTFYAKQMEYASALLLPIWKRLGQVFVIPIVGVGMFLIPGFIRSIWNAIAKRDVWLGSICLWFLGYGILYAVKLPVVYQHGRYLFPLIPIFFITGLLGTWDLVLLIKNKRNHFIGSMRIIGVCALICAVIFRFVGEKTYQADIQTIQRYMVEPALWIKNNTPENSVVATHDIGAMGYFGKRKILDLAGLIQPEVIPIIRDEQGIKRYLVEKKADYLVAFRDWYPELNNYGRLLAQFELPNQTGHEVVEIRILNTTTGK